MWLSRKALITNWAVRRVGRPMNVVPRAVVQTAASRAESTPAAATSGSKTWVRRRSRAAMVKLMLAARRNGQVDGPPMPPATSPLKANAAVVVAAKRLASTTCDGSVE